MGQFSWLYSDNEKQMIDNKVADSYLLVPPPFQNKYGKYILETCYDGYGRFGNYDVYDLIIEWNREMIPEIIRRMKNGNWHCSYNEDDIKELEYFYEIGEFKSLSEHNTFREKRWLGILIACYDEDNFALEYPIKITSEPMDYENAKPSKSDPNQGWEEYEDDYEEEEY